MVQPEYPYRAWVRVLIRHASGDIGEEVEKKREEERRHVHACLVVREGRMMNPKV